MYSMYYSRIKRPDPLTSRRKKGYVVGVIQLKPIPPIEQLVQNQYHVRILTSRLRQPILPTRGVFIPQATITTPHLLPLGYQSMVMMFLSNIREGLMLRNRRSTQVQT